MKLKTASLIAGLLLVTACTQETQNKFGRAIQNWTGTNGVLEIYAGDKLVRRFIEIDKLSTATSTQGNVSRPYRFGYGVLDENLNLRKDPGEEKVYFDTNRDTIKPESFGLLDEVARVLIDHPEILRIRVEGHTDSVGADAYNMDLSRRREEDQRDFGGVDNYRGQPVGQVIPPSGTDC